jgi:hypothetical protein
MAVTTEVGINMAPPRQGTFAYDALPTGAQQEAQPAVDELTRRA